MFDGLFASGLHDLLDPEQLKRTLVKISLAHEANEIEQYLWELDEDELSAS